MADTSYKKILAVNKTRAGRELVSSSLELLRLSNTTSYELDDLSVQTPDVEPKWTAKPRAISAALGQRLASWTQQTLRSFRLLLFMALGPWKKKEEEPKIALYTGWVSVLTGLLVHVLPLSACIALIYLNATSSFLGTHVSTLAFQFLAKFLELLAQASLASAVFVYLRALYTDPQPVPFGALFAGLQITSISYLWSLEFAGVVASKEFKRTRKFLFLLFIPLSVVLAAGIGPSIAIALTPTPGDFYGGWTVAWINATEEQIFPSDIDPTVLNYNLSSCSPGYCASYGWNTAMAIAQSQSTSEYPPQGSFVLTQDALPYREIRWNLTSGLFTGSLSVTATVPSKIVAWSLSSLAGNALSDQVYNGLTTFSANHTFTTISRQPTVTANCTQVIQLNSTSFESYDPDESDVQNELHRYVFQSEYLRSSNDTESFHWVFIDRDHLVFQGPSHSNGSIPSVWVFVRYSPGTIVSTESFAICAIHAGYAHVQNTVSSPAEGPADTPAEIVYVVSSQTISPRASTMPIPAIWLNQTLPPLSTLLDNGLVGVDMGTFLATSSAISMAQWPEQSLEYPGSPQAPRNDPGVIIGSDSDGSYSTSLRWLASSAGDHNFYPGSENAEDEGKYRLRMDVSYHGYGYQIDQTTKSIAISVLAAYCLYILTFVVLMLMLNRVYSNAWDSIGELTALAIMSRPDDKLRNTSAGVETVALFKLPVNIRVNDDNHLEIFFEDDSETSSSRIVEKDKKYN
ncbi:hypothetical protein KCU89_g708, partial [Aureobasidium melanogenum]